MNIKIETCFNNTFMRSFVEINENLLDNENIKFWDFTEDDYFELSELSEIRLILEGDYSNLINKIANIGYVDVNFNDAKIFVDKPNKSKSNDPIKNQFRMKIIKKGE